MSDEQYHAICPKCVSLASYDRVTEAVETLESHNEQRHGGEKVARLVREHRESLDEFMDYVEEEFGIDAYGEVGRMVVENDPMEVL